MRILGLIIAYLAAKNSIKKTPDRKAEDISCYMNCSKYFSLNPANGNRNSFCLPSNDV